MFKKNDSVILRAAFSLSSVPKPEFSYKDLHERFEGQEASLGAVREAIVAIRRGKFPDLAREGTAGSFFKNPIVSEAEAQKLKEQYPDMPIFALPETSGVKIPLAYLLDKVLGMRGYTNGHARLYEKQPLVITAEKECSAKEVRALAQVVQEKVFAITNIAIEPEVKIIY